MILIKPFESRDQEAVRRLILAGLAEHWGEIDPGLNPDLDDIAASYEDATFLVAWLDGRIVGSGALVPRSDDAAEIVRMSVASELRGRGIGKSMLNRLCREAAEAGFRRLVLETDLHLGGCDRVLQEVRLSGDAHPGGPVRRRGPPRTRTAPGAGAARFMKRKILLVVSTRPNFMKVAPHPRPVAAAPGALRHLPGPHRPALRRPALRRVLRGPRPAGTRPPPGGRLGDPTACRRGASWPPSTRS